MELSINRAELERFTKPRRPRAIVEGSIFDAESAQQSRMEIDQIMSDAVKNVNIIRVEQTALARAGE